MDAVLGVHGSPNSSSGLHYQGGVRFLRGRIPAVSKMVLAEDAGSTINCTLAVYCLRWIPPGVCEIWLDPVPARHDLDDQKRIDCKLRSSAWPDGTPLILDAAHLPGV